MRVPHPTVIHVEHLPAPSRRRLRAILAHRESVVPTIAAATTARGWGLVAAVAVATAIGAGTAALDRGGSSRLLIAIGLVVGALALVTIAALRWRRLARAPFPPGRYVIGAFVIDATTALLRVAPIGRTRPAVLRHRGRFRLAFEADDHRHVLPIADRNELQRVMAWIHGDMIAYATALARGDLATAGHLDPLAEARDRDGAVIGTASASRRRAPTPAAGRPSPTCQPHLRPPPSSDKSQPTSPM